MDEEDTINQFRSLIIDAPNWYSSLSFDHKAIRESDHADLEWFLLSLCVLWRRNLNLALF